MSEDFVDVSWRGLEVARKARLRGIAGGRGHLEHGTPMPTGTALTVTTANGLELAAVVTIVREQIGGRAEPPGMDLAITATGDAAAWWQARVDAATAAAAAAVAQTRTRTIPPAELAAAAAAAGQAPLVAQVRATATRPPAPATDEARPTEVMAAVTAPDDPTDPDGVAPIAAAPPAVQAPPVVEAMPEAVPEELSDDGRRTSVMDAVDIEAIVAASADAAAAADGTDDEPSSGGSNGDKKKVARGKRRRGR